MKVVNRTFHRNYQEVEKYEAGIVLTGPEVKSIKEENIKLDDAFVKILDEEAYLVNADIPIYHFARPAGYDPRHRRKLLLHKKELIRLKTKLQSAPSLTIAPISCYNKGHIIKVEIALAKGRKDIEKRKLEKARDIERTEKKMVKEYMKS
jgi:SsrA-binding protein